MDATHSTRTQQTSDAASSATDEALAVSELLAKSGLFSFLGRCLEEEVDRELLDLVRGPLLEDLEEAGIRFSREFLDAPADEVLAVLEEEFTCMFVAPGGIVPYASVFETGRMFQEPADRALAAYRQAGWDFRQIHSGEFPDHIGTMLAFLARLFEAENASLEQGGREEAESWKALRERFLLEELGPWAPGWCRRARKFALHEFYVHVLNLAEAALWRELEITATRASLRELAALNRRDPVKIDYDADFRKASGL